MPRPHDVIPDPTGRYVLIPDLGADSVRVFQISYKPETVHKLVEVASVKVAAGSGPRHGAFVRTGDRTYFYILNQISNTLVGFQVTYLKDKTLEFQQVSEINLLLRMDGSLVQTATMASELQVSV
jgi:6-phosphogluconolactonase (cycloisomerase 2 family)